MSKDKYSTNFLATCTCKLRLPYYYPSNIFSHHSGFENLPVVAGKHSVT